MNSLKISIKNFNTLVTMNILDIRTTWMFQMIFGIITPFGFMYFLKFYIDINDSDQLTKLLSGNIVISMTMPILLLLTSRLSILKKDGSIDYYRTLPINMNIFIFSLVTSFLLTYIPSIIVIYFFGSLFLGLKIISIKSLFIIFFVQIISILTMIGIATLIGIKAGSPEIANAVGNIIFTIFISISPILIPDEKIPYILRKISYLVPTTYSAKLINMSLNNVYNIEFYIYCLIMVFLSVLSVILLKRLWK